MIDINKKYRTRDGRKVVLYTVNGTSNNLPIVGEVINSNGVSDVYRWYRNGFRASNCYTSSLDLIEDTNEIECDANEGFYIKVERYKDSTSISIRYGMEVVEEVFLSPTKTRQLIQMLEEAIDD